MIFGFWLNIIYWLSGFKINHSAFVLCAFLYAFSFIPIATATITHDPFSDISFHDFVDIIAAQFSSNISLATVLSLLFTILGNPELLNLHSRAQNPQLNGERSTFVTGWMTALARAVQEKLDSNAKEIFKTKDNLSSLSYDQVTTTIALKLDTLAKELSLNPYNACGHFVKKLGTISDQKIQPALVICSEAMECELSTCEPGLLHQNSRDRDIPRVTLIKGAQIFEKVNYIILMISTQKINILSIKVHVLAGKCTKCKTTYYADHHRILHNPRIDSWNQAYINSALYLKIGHTVWADRIFSNSVLNGMYNFHASASAYTQFWNESFWDDQVVQAYKISHQQVWQAFVQESLRRMAQLSGVNLLLSDALPINEVTKHAFNILGARGIIQSANDHECSECTHSYKATADTIEREDVRQDPAALLGVDEHRDVPVLTGENANHAAQDTALARATSIATQEPEDVEMHNSDSSSDSSEDFAPVKMVVLDGIVMGHTVCVIMIFIIYQLTVYNTALCNRRLHRRTC